MRELPLPANLDAERSVLGAVLLDNESLDRIAKALTADAFSLDSHRRIYQVMLQLQESSRPIDIVTASEELRSKRELEAIGGIAYLGSLTEIWGTRQLVRAGNIGSYIDILRKTALARRVASVCDALQQQACSPSFDVSTLEERTAELLEEVQREARPSQNTDNLFAPAKQFIATLPPDVDWLIEGVIERKANGFFCAVPKGGKSWAAIDMAISLALGCEWLEFRIPRPAKVALISREDNPSLTGWRLAHLLKGKPDNGNRLYQLNTNLYVNSRAQTNELMLDNRQQVADLKAALKRREIEFAIFDVFNVLHSADENDNTEMRAVLKQLSGIQAEVGCGIGVVHHFNKADSGSMTQRLRGSSAIAGWAEWLIGISLVDEETKTRRMDFELKAACPPDPVYYQIVTEEAAVRLKRTVYAPTGATAHGEKRRYM